MTLPTLIRNLSILSVRRSRLSGRFVAATVFIPAIFIILSLVGFGIILKYGARYVFSSSFPLPAPTPTNSRTDLCRTAALTMAMVGLPGSPLLLFLIAPHRLPSAA